MERRLARAAVGLIASGRSPRIRVSASASRVVGSIRLLASRLTPIYRYFAGMSSISTTLRLIVDLPAPSGPIRATVNTPRCGFTRTSQNRIDDVKECWDGNRVWMRETVRLLAAKRLPDRLQFEPLKPLEERVRTVR